MQVCVSHFFNVHFFSSSPLCPRPLNASLTQVPRRRMITRRTGSDCLLGLPSGSLGFHTYKWLQQSSFWKQGIHPAIYFKALRSTQRRPRKARRFEGFWGLGFLCLQEADQRVPDYDALKNKAAAASTFRTMELNSPPTLLRHIHNFRGAGVFNTSLGGLLSSQWGVDGFGLPILMVLPIMVFLFPDDYCQSLTG